MVSNCTLSSSLGAHDWVSMLLGMSSVDLPSPVRPRLCPVEQALDVLGHRWTALIIWHLRSGRLRHAELSTRLPRITAKVLTERLRELEGLGVLARTIHAETPPRVEYALTARGLELAEILDELESWWKARNGETSLAL